MRKIPMPSRGNGKWGDYHNWRFTAFWTVALFIVAGLFFVQGQHAPSPEQFRLGMLVTAVVGLVGVLVAVQACYNFVNRNRRVRVRSSRHFTGTDLMIDFVDEDKDS